MGQAQITLIAGCSLRNLPGLIPRSLLRQDRIKHTLILRGLPRGSLLFFMQIPFGSKSFAGPGDAIKRACSGIASTIVNSRSIHLINFRSPELELWGNLSRGAGYSLNAKSQLRVKSVCFENIWKKSRGSVVLVPSNPMEPKWTASSWMIACRFSTSPSYRWILVIFTFQSIRIGKFYRIIGILQYTCWNVNRQVRLNFYIWKPIFTAKTRRTQRNNFFICRLAGLSRMWKDKSNSANSAPRAKRAVWSEKKLMNIESSRGGL